MLRYYVKTTEALKRLRTDKDGVVSFEYIIVAFCIVAAVAAVFNSTTTASISTALSTALGNVTRLDSLHHRLAGQIPGCPAAVPAAVLQQVRRRLASRHHRSPPAGRG